MSRWVYILRCGDGSYYTGSTANLDERIGTHKQGLGGRWTRGRLPVEEVFAEHFDSYSDAVNAERQIKGWSRLKKEALIAGRFDLLIELSRSETTT